MFNMNRGELVSFLVATSLSLSRLALLLVGTEAAAALGRTPSAMLASPASTAPVARKLSVNWGIQAIAYTQHSVQLENGTTVQEYATPAGIVFAVVWRGPVLPDLSALLGDYFSVFKAEADRSRSIGRRGSPVALVSGKLIVRSGGRMRNFFGYAYAPELVPAGLDIKDVVQ